MNFGYKKLKFKLFVISSFITLKYPTLIIMSTPLPVSSASSGSNVSRKYTLEELMKFSNSNENSAVIRKNVASIAPEIIAHQKQPKKPMQPMHNLTVNKNS